MGTDVANTVRKPLAGDVPLARTLDEMVREGELYEKLDHRRVLCHACGHRCVIPEGGRGICQVRFNRGGKLYVPHGYVAALQCDPTEKKPFFHILPGSNTLTFGMLGCDFHCGYCFTGDTRVVTSKGILPLKEIFDLGARFENTADAEIAFPDGLQAIAASGTWRAVRQVFKHHYSGPLAVIRPLYLPELRCTPEHHVYATLDPSGNQPQVIEARCLTSEYYLAIPKHYAFSQPQVIDAARRQVKESENYFWASLREIASEPFDGNVYNIEVDEEHNYLANMFLVSNCQNWYTSQALRDSNAGIEPSPVTAERMIAFAKSAKAKLVGSSYNEPLITSEWAVEVFRAAVHQGLRCVYISNGNVTREVLDYIRPYVDGYKIDLKTMNDKNYRKLGGVLQNVLDGIRMVHDKGFWTEIVTLVIPGFNDSNEELMDAAQYIRSISPDIPWHVTAFHQDYKMTEPDNTNVRTLLRAVEIGQEAGLHYVYAGNLPGQVGPYENTFCPKCNTLLIERYGYRILQDKLSGRGVCPKCAEKIPGIWV